MLAPSSNPFSLTISLISLSLILSLPFPLKGETLALPKSPSSAFIQTQIYAPKPGKRGEDRRTVPQNWQIDQPQGVIRRRRQGWWRRPPSTLVEFIGRSQATAPGLEEKLGKLAPAHAFAGSIARYFVERYQFKDSCLVIQWSGDNPNSLAGLFTRFAWMVQLRIICA